MTQPTFIHPTLDTIHRHFPQIALRIEERHGSLIESEIEELAANESTRLLQVLVKCGSCRFTCATQDATHIIRAVEAIGDYVRDVQVPAADFQRILNAGS